MMTRRKGKCKMKVKTTRKAIVNGSCNVKCAGYCDLSYLLNNHSPIAYTCGVYGWNFDVYEAYCELLYNETGEEFEI